MTGRHRAHNCAKTAGDIGYGSLRQKRVLGHSLLICPSVKAVLRVPRRYDFAYRLVSIVSGGGAVRVGTHLIALGVIEGCVRLCVARGESGPLVLLIFTLPKSMFVDRRLLILV